MLETSPVPNGTSVRANRRKLEVTAVRKVLASKTSTEVVHALSWLIGLTALAIADNTIRLGMRGETDWPATTWTTLTAHARRIAWTHDGVLIAIGSDGAVFAASRTIAGVLAGRYEVLERALVHVRAARDALTP